MDLSPDTLEMLVHLMCAQARECLFEKAELQLKEEESEEKEEEKEGEKKRKKGRHLEMCLVIGQEAAHVRSPFTNFFCIFSRILFDFSNKRKISKPSIFHETERVGTESLQSSPQ